MHTVCKHVSIHDKRFFFGGERERERLRKTEDVDGGSRTAPMSTTMKSVLAGMVLHSSAQKALLASVVPATSATRDVPVFGGGG